MMSSLEDKIIPAEKRTGSGAYSMAMLCKQDKEQLDRIEEKLDSLISPELCAREVLDEAIEATKRYHAKCRVMRAIPTENGQVRVLEKLKEEYNERR